MSYILEKPYVYVVLEHAMVIEGDEIVGLESSIVKDCVLHGVYTDEDMALGKAASVNIKSKGFHGYISVLKKPINGKLRYYERVLHLNNVHDLLEG